MSNLNMRGSGMETPRDSQRVFRSRSSSLNYQIVDDDDVLIVDDDDVLISETNPTNSEQQRSFPVPIVQLGYDIEDVIETAHRLRYEIEDVLPHSNSLSYEDLLLVEERIGKISTGLSHEAIRRLLKTRIYVSTNNAEICVVCQAEYEDGDRIGTVCCGHEFHADCISEWLTLKNSCPLCKSMALPI